MTRLLAVLAATFALAQWVAIYWPWDPLYVNGMESAA